jgi:D-2-hydroxyacid dehydrogenase (NADP+)
VALSLTPDSEQIIDATELAPMRPDAWLVNVARGRHMDTKRWLMGSAHGVLAGQRWM